MQPKISHKTTVKADEPFQLLYVVELITVCSDSWCLWTEQRGLCLVSKDFLGSQLDEEQVSQTSFVFSGMKNDLNQPTHSTLLPFCVTCCTQFPASSYSGVISLCLVN